MSRRRGDPDEMIADGRAWKRVPAPKPWRPREEGVALVCRYVGTKQKRGREGEFYDVVLLRDVSTDQVWTVSGTVINSLFMCLADTDHDKLLRLVWLGMREPNGPGNAYKDYDLYVEEKQVEKGMRARGAS